MRIADSGGSLLTVSINTLLSRILGFTRDLLIARIFGADAGTDAFIVAFKLPNMLRRLFVEGAFALALVPLVTEYRQQRPAELKNFIGRLAGSLIVFLFPLLLLGLVAAPLLVALFAPGFWYEPQRFWLTTTMLQISLPYVPLIILTACAGAILNSHHQFWAPTFTPVLLNICIIVAAIKLAPQLAEPIMALAWGVLIAGIVQLTFQVPFLMRINLLVRPQFVPQDLGVRKVWQLIGPALFGTSVTQLNVVLDTLLVSFLPVGSISWLYYANQLLEFPQGILGSALGTVILPRLASCHACADTLTFSRILDQALRMALLFGLPAAVGLWLLALPIMATLFESARFTANDVAMAAACLKIYAVGLPAYLVARVLAPGYYARQDTNVPVRVAVVVIITNLIISLLLIGHLAHLGLAWSSAIAAVVNAILLWRGLVAQGAYQAAPGWVGFLLRIVTASIFMGIVIVLMRANLVWTPNNVRTLITRYQILDLLLQIITGGIVYLMTLFLLGLRIERI